MASIQKQRNGRYRARYRDHAGREHARHFARKVDAQRWVDEQTAALVTGRWVDPRASRTTFAEAAQTFLASSYLRPSSERTYRSYLDNHLLPAFGARPLGAIRTSEVKMLVKQLQDDLAPTTVTAVHNLLASIFKTAVTDGLVASSPCVRTAPPKGRSAGFVVLEPGQVWALADEMPARWRVGVLLAAGCGLRLGETLGLRLHRVDFLRREVGVVEQLLRVPGEGIGLGPPKTTTSATTVPMPGFVVDELARHVSTLRLSGQDFVLQGRAGSPVHETSYRPAFARAVRSAGLPAETTPHDLRHFTATAMIAAGDHVKKVQRVMRHASATETLDVYAGLWPDEDGRRTLALDRAMAGPADNLRTVGDGS